MTDTFTNRHLDLTRVTSLEGGVHFETGWSFGPSDDQKALLSLYEHYFVETGRGNQITGMATVRAIEDGFRVNEWLWHKSDQDLDREHEEWLADLDRRREAELADNQDDWLAREAALPLPLRRRLDRFHANGGRTFKLEGWGYELVVCELAALYASSGGEDTAEVLEYARLRGTSGNQHDMAKALGAALASGSMEAEDAVANAPSALTPLTGNSDYSGSRA